MQVFIKEILNSRYIVAQYTQWMVPNIIDVCLGFLDPNFLLAGSNLLDSHTSQKASLASHDRPWLEQLSSLPLEGNRR